MILTGVRTYIERDVRDLAQMGDEEKFIRFMTSAAARTGSLLNLSAMARDVGGQSVDGGTLAVRPDFLQYRLPAASLLRQYDEEDDQSAEASTKFPEVINVLLDSGASVKTKDKEGRKALDFARRNNKLKKSEAIGRLRG